MTPWFVHWKSMFKPAVIPELCPPYLPRVHLERQYEQKRKKCHHPHLQQTGLDWMSTLAPNQESNNTNYLLLPGKLEKMFCVKHNLNLF